MDVRNADEIEHKRQVKAAKEEEETKLAASIKVGNRCEIDSETHNPKRGQVLFIGTFDI